MDIYVDRETNLENIYKVLHLKKNSQFWLKNLLMNFSTKYA